jgi:atypical dual specificity phosphatase
LEPGDILRWFYDLIRKRPMNVSFVDDYVAGSARPFSRAAVLYLKEDLGVESILSLTEKNLDPNLVQGMLYKHVAMQNHMIPTIEQLQESVQFLLSQANNKRKTVVHCAAGKGRTGTVLAAYLSKKYGYPAEKAISITREKRHGSVEKKQEKIIDDYVLGSQRI